MPVQLQLVGDEPYVYLPTFESSTDETSNSTGPTFTFVHLQWTVLTDQKCWLNICQSCWFNLFLVTIFLVILDQFSNIKGANDDTSCLIPDFFSWVSSLMIPTLLGASCSSLIRDTSSSLIPEVVAPLLPPPWFFHSLDLGCSIPIPTPTLYLATGHLIE